MKSQANSAGAHRNEVSEPLPPNPPLSLSSVPLVVDGFPFPFFSSFLKSIFLLPLWHLAGSTAGVYWRARSQLPFPSLAHTRRSWYIA